MPKGVPITGMWIVRFDDGEVLSLLLTRETYDPTSRDEGSWRLESEANAFGHDPPPDLPDVSRQVPAPAAAVPDAAVSSVPGMGWADRHSCRRACNHGTKGVQIEPPSDLGGG